MLGTSGIFHKISTTDYMNCVQNLQLHQSLKHFSEMMS